ncbi:MAG: FHA domain-containing protein [Acidobacteria bacterium]|nr:FHA domain-containing protein [Acidobacteriota bacterium]
MAKLILKFEAAVIKEIPLKKASLTIGRTPGNDVVIDNMAVSGNHAKIVVDQDHFVVEDLNSLNGTFVNGQRIRRTTLKDGDEVLIGKHTLVLQEEGGLPRVEATMESTQPLISGAEHTVVLDTKKRREFLAKATTVATEGASTAAADKIGCLTVLEGKTDQREYILTSKLCVIGKSAMASIKLKGWFTPKTAAIINRREGRYEIAPSEKAGVAKVNSQVLSAPRVLQEGDQIQIGGVKMQFFFRE